MESTGIEPTTLGTELTGEELDAVILGTFPEAEAEEELRLLELENFPPPEVVAKALLVPGLEPEDGIIAPAPGLLPAPEYGTSAPAPGLFPDPEYGTIAP